MGNPGTPSAASDPPDPAVGCPRPPPEWYPQMLVAQLAANLGEKWPKRIGFLWISIENPRWFTISGSSGTAGKHGTKWKNKR